MYNCFISPSRDPYFNLAIEEYLLKNTEDEIFMLYINNPSIIVGKHQNLLSEINVYWAYENNICLARRISGGGTVYHDQGNLNFCFITNCPDLEKVNYIRFTQPIIKALNSLGINAENSSRNDLLLNKYKISGNAMHIHKNRVLCHGTLLFNSDLKNLSLALRNKPDRYIDKSIKSVPSKVINIVDYSPEISMNEFTRTIFQLTINSLEDTMIDNLCSKDIKRIEELRKEKYSSWDWIYGYSPKYVFKNELFLMQKAYKFNLVVEKGIIQTYVLEDNNPNIKLIFNYLIGTKHDINSLKSLFTEKDFLTILPYYSSDEFCRSMF